MMPEALDLVFAVDVAIILLLLTGAIWSVAYPARRLWPPPARASWQFRSTWFLFYLSIGLNAALLILDWNSWIFESNLRFVLGVPIALIGTLLIAWGLATLGTQNSLGLRDAFVVSGPYVFTRNPQYMAYMIVFVGLSFIANSVHLWITHVLLILIFALLPLAEESWLEEQYGEDYIKYKRGTSRFL